MSQEMWQAMLDRVYKLSDQQAEMLARQAEMAADQRHTAETVEAIKHDISDVRAVQAVHSADIRTVRDRISSITPPSEWLKKFVMEHPVISVILALMGINIILGSLGLPLIDIKSTWALLSNGS